MDNGVSIRSVDSEKCRQDRIGEAEEMISPKSATKYVLRDHSRSKIPPPPNGVLDFLGAAASVSDVLPKVSTQNFSRTTAALSNRLEN
jgi:hypothetical protein